MVESNATLTGWSETNGGRKFYFDPELIGENEYDLDDIAHGLARNCRYSGHVNVPHYSVAEHVSILADYVWSRRDMFPNSVERAQAALTMLHHDDPEFMLGDMVRPMKRFFPLFKTLEEEVDKAVAKKWDLIYPHPSWLKDFDTRILVDERAQVRNPSLNDWNLPVEGLGVEIGGVVPHIAKRLYLNRHHKYDALRSK